MVVETKATNDFCLFACFFLLMTMITTVTMIAARRKAPTQQPTISQTSSPLFSSELELEFFLTSTTLALFTYLRIPEQL